MSDFIREVDEDYRRDRAMQFLSRYQVLIAIVIVLVIGGAGFYRYWADTQVANAEKVNDRFMAAAQLAKDGKSQEAEQAYAAIARDGPAGYAMLSRMRAAESRAAHDPEAAAKDFDTLAGDEAIPASMRDTARLRGAMIRIDTDDPKAFEQRYGRFSVPGFAFANSMRELLALAALKRQDMDAAGRYLDEIIIDPNVPSALRGRAQAFRTLVTAGPATDSASQPPPGAVTIVGQAAPAVPKAAPNAAPATVTPPAPSPAAPPAAATAPTPPAAAPATPVPPSIKPPGPTPPD